MWLGDFTALYLEIGEVVTSYPDSGRPKAQYCAYLGFDWDVEAEHGGGLSSAESDANSRVTSLLKNRRIAAVVASASLELELHLESGALIRSAAKRGDAPDWTLYLPSGECVASEAGSIVVETGSGSIDA